MLSKARTGGDVLATLAKWFPERQIYHRAEGKVSYITISTPVQVVLVASVALLAGWLIFASASFALRGRIIDLRTIASQTQVMRYERLLQEARSREASALALLETRTQEFRRIAGDLENRHRALELLLGVEDAAPASPAGVPMASVTAPGPALRGDGAAQPAAVRMAELKVEQARMMTVAAETANARISAARTAIETAGLTVEDLVGEDTAMGGPLVDLDLSAIAPDLPQDEEFTERFADVAQRLAEAEELERVVEASPFRSPVAVDYRITSRFGGRVDPFTRSSADHTRLDLGAYHRAPVVTTASGTVSFAGWKGGYGRTIEIDHGNGFKTRYGHLSQIEVEAGQKVSGGDLIATMGSTGRSTGTHLHYEVWFNGKLHDPAKFLKAGAHVQQG